MTLFKNDLLVPLFTDMAFGLLFVVGILTFILTEFRHGAMMFTFGAMSGYTIHIASHMMGFSINANTVESSDVDT